jgi:hypothetical protein
MDYLRWVAGYCGIVRYVGHYDRTSANDGTLANRNASDNYGIRKHNHAISDCRIEIFTLTATQCDMLVKRDTCT